MVVVKDSGEEAAEVSCQGRVLVWLHLSSVLIFKVVMAGRGGGGGGKGRGGFINSINTGSFTVF